MLKPGKGIVVLASVGLLVAPINIGAQQCHRQVQLCLDTEYVCRPIPTSLRPVSAIASADEGWLPGGACGTRSCFLIGTCPCGTPLSKGVCTEGGGGACDCGPGYNDPCTYGGIELNEMLAADQVRGASAEASSEPGKLYLPNLGSALTKRHIGALEQTRSFYRDLTTVYLSAGVWFSFPDRTGEGEIEYWGSGQKYRLRSTVDPRLGLSSGIEAAYDGERYQLLYLADAILSLRRADPKQTPAPFLNPLFLPISFLGLRDDDCYACEPTLRTVVDEQRWLSRVGVARALAETSDGRTLVLPGSSLAGEPFFFRVVLAQDRDLVSRIEWARPSGRAVITLELSRYQRVEGSSRPFPHHMVMTSFDEKGERLLSIHYMVKTLRLNAPVEPTRFTIPFDDAQTVIDEDVPTFLKHRQLADEPLEEQ
jgi:hypothetical protein